MNRPRNTAVKIAGVALALSCMGGVLAGCSGSDGGSSEGAPAPTESASTSPSASDPASPSATTAPVSGALGKFCAKFSTLNQGVLQADPADGVKHIHEWAADMEDLGAPKGMSDEERSGFETMVGAFGSIAELKDVGALDQKMSAKQNKDMAAFGAWMGENCAPPAQPSTSPAAG